MEKRMNQSAKAQVKDVPATEDQVTFLIKRGKMSFAQASSMSLVDARIEIKQIIDAKRALLAQPPTQFQVNYLRDEVGVPETVIKDLTKGECSRLIFKHENPDYVRKTVSKKRA